MSHSRIAEILRTTVRHRYRRGQFRVFDRLINQDAIEIRCAHCEQVAASVSALNVLRAGSPSVDLDLLVDALNTAESHQCPLVAACC